MRDRGQLIGGVSRPLLWVIVMGIGLNPYFRGEVYGEVRFVVMPFSRFRSIPSIDPHSSPAVAALGAAVDNDAPAGVPAALGLLAVLPASRSRRRDDAFLPPAARRRSRT